VEAPNFVDLVISQTEPGFAGNTASNTYKPATVETGFELMVPLFINIGMLSASIPVPANICPAPEAHERRYHEKPD
jgi:hypothetical protein